MSLHTTARDEAATVLARAGATVATTGQDTLTVSGLAADRVVSVLSERQVPFSEVSAHKATLEQVYLDLTRDSVEYRPADMPTGPADGRAAR